MKKLKLAALTLPILFSVNTLASTFACTHFQIESPDGSIINARSMEYGIDTKTWKSLPANFVIHKKLSVLNDTVKKSKLGYAGIETYEGILTEGVNEKGLSMAILWFTEGQYPENLNKENSIKNTDVMKWALSQFDNADEVIANLKKMNVYAPIYQVFGGALPLHYSITDRHGKNYVVEFIDKEMKIFDNTENRVLTNDPRLDKQLDKLKLFYNNNPNLKDINTSGELNSLPGGYGSQERFIKISVLRNLLPTPESNTTAINQSISLLNNVDYPRGVPAYEADAKAGRGDSKQETSWISIIDLNKMKYYYRTTTNYNVKVIDLDKIGFDRDVIFSLYDDQQSFIDVTPKLTMPN
ncbi:linear amide C-N hydrolase [Yersinia alsatica]|uniref:linear amide C-N hydrolase n=1 Tax=Yersinia alsatica TaxID=2890317 RepID=UPI0011A8C119|nr:linear amide C-N hydrolase [Yersinia alsatica]